MKLHIINNVFVQRKSDNDKKHALIHTSYTTLIIILCQIVFLPKRSQWQPESHSIQTLIFMSSLPLLRLLLVFDHVTNWLFKKLLSRFHIMDD